MKNFPNFAFRPRRAGALALAALLAACTVGPDFKRPMPPGSAAYSVAPLPASTVAADDVAGAAQRFHPEQQIPAQWWSVFHSPRLDALIKQAFAASPSIESAQAALRQAQENVAAQQGFFFPSVQASYAPSRTKIAGNAGGNSPGTQGNGSVIATTSNTPAAQGGSAPFVEPVLYTFHTSQLTISYVPDVFGANRRQVESLQAQAAQQRFQLDAAYLTLASNVVAAALQDASLRAQIAATRHIIEANQKALDIVRRQFEHGYAMRIDVASQESALAAAQQQLPPLVKQHEQTRDLLAVLLGQAPGEPMESEVELSDLHLPQELPLSLPATLIAQRPDVRAAEEQLHSASAQVGVAVANRLPQFSINGTIGGEASVFSEMFKTGGPFWNLLGNITQPVFDGGTLLHRERAADQALVQAAAQYRATVLNALQNVADTMHAIHSDAAALQAAVKAESAAKVVLDITRRQFELGSANMLALLAAQQAHQQATIAVVQARAARFGDTAALFQALGGGWDQPTGQ